MLYDSASMKCQEKTPTDKAHLWFPGAGGLDGVDYKSMRDLLGLMKMFSTGLQSWLHTSVNLSKLIELYFKMDTFYVRKLSFSIAVKGLRCGSICWALSSKVKDSQLGRTPKLLVQPWSGWIGEATNRSLSH